jgi:Bax protein
MGIYSWLANNREDSLMRKIILFSLSLIFSFFTHTLYAQLPDFTQYTDVKAKKAAFFNYLTPTLVNENKAILQQREKIQHIQQACKQQKTMSSNDEHILQKISQEYQVANLVKQCDTDWQELLSRVDQVPISLALAQAANESAWGTSRFAKEGNNLFGQWCHTAGCGIVPARRNAGAQHEVAKFSNVAESVKSYLRNLNTHNAYTALRKKRAMLRELNQTLTGEALAKELTTYSERGHDYVNELISMIRFNALHEYDLS